MNYIYLSIILTLVVLFGVYFYFTRKLIRNLIDSARAFQEAGNKVQKDLFILTEQYRQLVNINKALREVYQSKPVKNLKKK